MHVNFDPHAPIAPQVEFADFLKLDIRIGTVVTVEDFPEARNPSYKLTLDFGPAVGIKKSAAQVTALYSKEQLIGKKVAAVVNFAPRQIGKFMSQVLILGFSNLAQQVVLFEMDHAVPDGARLH